jgi:glycerate kinase
MKILIAPDKFKGSLNSQEVCNAIEEGIIEILPDTKITKLPLADGGEGSLDVLEKALNFKRIYLEVNNPLFKPHKTYYGLLNKTAYVVAILERLKLVYFSIFFWCNMHYSFKCTIKAG